MGHLKDILEEFPRALALLQENNIVTMFNPIKKIFYITAPNEPMQTKTFADLKELENKLKSKGGDLKAVEKVYYNDISI